MKETIEVISEHEYDSIIDYKEMNKPRTHESQPLQESPKSEAFIFHETQLSCP